MYNILVEISSGFFIPKILKSVGFWLNYWKDKKVKFLENSVYTITMIAWEQWTIVK